MSKKVTVLFAMALAMVLPLSSEGFLQNPSASIPPKKLAKKHSLIKSNGKSDMSVTSLSFSAPRTQHGVAPIYMSTDSTDAKAVEDKDKETFEFQAEVSRVMDIIINSLYSDKDVFLRELVSNAADACDKKRFLSLTTDGSEGEGGPDGDQKVGIRIIPDAEGKTLTIEDSGIGMSKTELIENLGRIAQSGTKKFAEALKGTKTEDEKLNLIGQFGVGFYSGFLVADKMTVVTKPFTGGDGKAYKWESKAGDSYFVSEANDEESKFEMSGCGTKITLHLKDDCEEYTDVVKLKNLLHRYSEFIQFPIEVWTEKTDYIEVPDETAEPPKEGEKAKMKTIPQKSNEWELVNQAKPIWLKSPRSVEDQEYQDFYRTTFRMYDTPLNHTHFSLEGQVEFKALLYVPSTLPYELVRSMFDEDSRAIKLYVKRVFINDKFDELLPRYLTFLRGVVDSEDLPLNVGREILQKTKMLNVIQKRLVRKSLDMFKEIEKDEEKYKKFFTTFGKYLKVGVIEDVDNKDELASLTRWSTTESETEIYSLDEYVARMKPDQKQIYYVTGETRKIALSSPALEGLRKKGFEVLFLQDPLDEMAMQAIMKYKDYDIVDAAKEVAELDENEKKEVEAKTEELSSLTEWIQNLLGKRVTKVQVSTRLTDSPAAIVQSAYGMSPQMQRYYAAQSTMDDSIMDSQFNQAILEINPNHPVVQQLNSLVGNDKDSNEAKELGKMIFDLAQVTGGYGIEDPGAFGARITKMMVKNAGLSGFENGETTRDVEDPTVENVQVEPVKTDFNPEVVDMAENAEDLRKRGYVEDVEDESI